MAMNVRRPGFQLLSLLPKQYWIDDTTTHADQICLMPDQLSIYLSTYTPLLLVSLLIVFLLNIAGAQDHPKLNGSGAAGTSYQQRTPMLAVRSTSSRKDDNDSHYAHQNLSVFLPPPVSTPKYGFFSQRSRSFFLLGRRRRLSISAPLGSVVKVMKTLLFGSSGTRSIRRRGIVQGFVHDVWSIAALPLSTFVFISLWTMYF